MLYKLASAVLPPPASTFAKDTDWMFYFITWVSVFFFVLIVALMLYFMVKYKRKSEDDVTPNISHNLALEVIWSVVPIILVCFMFYWGYKGYARMNDPSALFEEVGPDGKYIDLYVTGKQWSWDISYPNGIVVNSRTSLKLKERLGLSSIDLDMCEDLEKVSIDFEKDAMAGASGMPGSFSNSPPDSPEMVASGSLGETSGADMSSMASSSSTRNYELDREIRYVKQQVGRIDRISVAVVVNQDFLSSKDSEDGDPRGISEAELAQFIDVVKGVIGFSEGRGDTVTVVPSSFAVAVDQMPDLPWYKDQEMVDLIKYGASLLLILAVLLFVARPIIKANMPEVELDIPIAALDGELSDGDRQMISMGEGETLEEIKAKLRPKKSSIPLEMLDTANTYDDKVAVLRMLSADDAGRVANLLKRMIDA